MSISLGSQYLFRKISKFFTYITWITEVEQIYASTSVTRQNNSMPKQFNSANPQLQSPQKKQGASPPAKISYHRFISL